MSFDQKKNGNMENDELKIKSHLNTSLEKEGISVSEDLINRTLEAIRKQSQEATGPVRAEQERQPERKVIPWFKYARNFAAVAAAGMILVLGINGLEQTGKKSDQSETAKEKENGISYDMAATDQAAPEAADSKADAGNSVMEFAAQSGESTLSSDNNGEDEIYGINSEEKLDDSVMVTEDTDAVLKAAGKAPTSDDGAEGDRLLLSFREICPILPEEAQDITITGNADQGERLISDSEEIKLFYNQMESYAYAEGVTEESNVHLTAVIRKADGIFEMRLEEGTLATSYTSGGATVENRFEISDYMQLLKDLEGWYQTNN